MRAALFSRDFELAEDEVAGHRAVVAQRDDFRWRWFGVRLHTAVVVAGFKPDESGRSELDRFLGAASQWAVEHRRGSPRLGLQSATAAVAVAVLSGGAGEALGWAAEPHGHRFAALSYPVAVDLEQEKVIEPRRMVIGGLFAPFLRGVVHDVLRVSLQNESPADGVHR